MSLAYYTREQLVARLADVESRIDEAEKASSIKDGSGIEIVKGTLFRLYEERDRIIEAIQKKDAATSGTPHGRTCAGQGGTGRW